MSLIDRHTVLDPFSMPPVLLPPAVVGPAIVAVESSEEIEGYLTASAKGEP